MANDFYQDSGSPSTGSQGASQTMRAEFAAIEVAFDKLPTLTANGGKIIAVNSGGTALEAVTTTGTGSAVRATSPTLVTPNLGTPTSGVLTNCTGLPVAGGGTGLTSLTANRIPYGNGTSAFQSSASFTFDGSTFSVPITAFADGTVGTPSVYWGTNTQTGFYRIGTNNIGVTVNGTKLLDMSAALFGITGNATASGTFGVGNAGNSGIQSYITGSGTKIFLLIDGAGGTCAYTGTNSQTFASGESATASALFLRKDGTSGRSLSSAGTNNASGADYAEYERKSASCGVVAKGQIIGFDADGKLTDAWTLAKSFGVKSTDPSYVGGDAWGSEDALGLIKPALPGEDATEDELMAYAATLSVFNEALEAARQTVDRIAYSGKVPVNVTGAQPGDYIIAVQDGGGISGQVVSDPDFAQYKKAVGRVRRILADGRAEIAVMVH